MTTMVAERYEALKEAGASDSSARAAAVAITSSEARFDRIDDRLSAAEGRLHHIENRLDRIEVDVGTLKGDASTLKVDTVEIRGKIGAIQWVLGGVGFGVLLLVIKSFWPV